MSKFKVMVLTDIEFCDELINKGRATHTDIQTLIGKYIMDYPDFDKGIITYASFAGFENNEIENIKIIKGKLEYLLNRIGNPTLYNKQNNIGTTIFNTNNNTNTNSNNINSNMSVDEIRMNINDNTYLSDVSKQELLSKLEEIIELQKSKETKSQKWNKLKRILSFLLDKGADIAIMYIPQILIALNNK